MIAHPARALNCDLTEADEARSLPRHSAGLLDEALTWVKSA